MVNTKQDKDKLATYNHLIKVLARDYKRAREREDYKAEADIENKMAKVKMSFNTLVKLEPNNILHFINLNDGIMSRKNNLEGCKIIAQMMKIDIDSYYIKEELVTFISWSSGYNYTDSEILVLVKKLCKSSTINDSNLLLRLQSALEAASCFESAKYVHKTRRKIKNKLNNQEKVTTL